MATPYLEDLAFYSKNNEAIDEIIILQEEVDGVVRPLDLTGREFFAQARVAKSLEADLMCAITVTVYGDPTEGKLHFHVSEDVMKTVPAIKGHYDVLERAGVGANIDNLYMAPFIVEQGISDFDQWQ